jgi:rhamnopyranosyl-N-acetylglucosaminyl-diphospho-decaprenol beta-1,3/1,4-galactofuranosyltransferase
VLDGGTGGTAAVASDAGARVPAQGNVRGSVPDASLSAWAIVVTYNRKLLLRECLAALGAQTRRPDRILVVDNASTDGTPELIREEFPHVELLQLPDNRGGAGGFHAGLKEAHAASADWSWLMDDDTIPTPTALAELLTTAPPAGRPAPLLLASRAVWVDGQLHPMNEPTFKLQIDELAASSERGLLPLRTATFVSLLVHRTAVDRFGLPHAHFFIWSDDIEYTARVLRSEPLGYFVPTSVVEHRTRSPYTSVTDAGGRFYFHVRNTLYMLRGDAWSPREKLSIAWGLVGSIRAYLRHHEHAREPVVTVLRGVRDGLHPSPARRAARTRTRAVRERPNRRR